jgi:hypothetical protein
VKPRMRIWTFGTVIVGACLMATGGAAWAAQPNSPSAAGNSMAIAGVAFDGALPLEAQKVFVERLAEGLAKGEVSLRGNVTTPEGSVTCSDSACYRRLAATLGVSFMVVGKVSESQKNYEIDLELFSGATGRSSGNHHQRCQICGLSEASERMSLAASALTEKLRSLLHEPGHVVVRTQAAGALITVNGQIKGRAPQEVTLPAGRHKLMIEATGFRTLERDIVVVPAVDQELQIDMMEIPSNFPYSTMGWSAVAAGAGLIAAGVIAFTVFNGRKVTCDTSQKDKEGDCEKILSSTWAGAGLMAAGVGASTLGGVWLYLGSQQNQSGTGNTALNVGWQGRF